MTRTTAPAAPAANRAVDTTAGGVENRQAAENGEDIDIAAQNRSHKKRRRTAVEPEGDKDDEEPTQEKRKPRAPKPDRRPADKPSTEVFNTIQAHLRKYPIFH